MRISSVSLISPAPRTTPVRMTGGSARRLRLLYLAYFFPPLGGAGVQRTVKFVRYLPEFGVFPTVVSCAGDASSPRDESLADELPADLSVHRAVVPGPDGSGTRGWERISARLLLTEPRAMRAWRDGALALGEELSRREGVDVILATGSPFITFEAAAELARRLGVPWVADLRDPWALDEMTVPISALHRAGLLRRMRRSLASAAHVLMNVPEATRALRETFPELEARSSTLTNGYDADDLAVEPAPRDPKRFRIVHTGHLYVELGRSHARWQWLRTRLGGERTPVDIGTRSHVYLIRALEVWRSADPEGAARVELVLAGALSRADRELVEASSVSDLVRMLGYVDHRTSVSLLRSADLLFLPLHDVPEGHRVRIVPGKTYEYMAAGRPVLAAIPEGDALDFLRRANVVHPCRPADVAGIRGILESRVAAWRAGEAGLEPDHAFIRTFERRTLTEQLASVLRRVVEP